MSEFEANENQAISSDFNDFEEEQVAELEDTDDWGDYCLYLFIILTYI